MNLEECSGRCEPVKDLMASGVKGLEELTVAEKNRLMRFCTTDSQFDNNDQLTLFSSSF